MTYFYIFGQALGEASKIKNRPNLSNLPPSTLNLGHLFQRFFEISVTTLPTFRPPSLCWDNVPTAGVDVLHG